MNRMGGGGRFALLDKEPPQRTQVLIRNETTLISIPECELLTLNTHLIQKTTRLFKHSSFKIMWTDRHCFPSDS